MIKISKDEPAMLRVARRELERLRAAKRIPRGYTLQDVADDIAALERIIDGDADDDTSPLPGIE